MINLILNASKYAPPGTPIDVHMTSAGAHLRVTVADRGPGIPADATERLFEPYYRLAPAAESAADGVGLGLAIVKAIVEAHGGEVGAENRARGGAAFWFTLPVITDAAAEQLAANQQERG